LSLSNLMKVNWANVGYACAASALLAALAYHITPPTTPPTTHTVQL
jgi:hypothetical protein